MFSAAVLILGALAASSTADFGYYSHPGYYSGYPWGSSFYRTQYHNQANYVPLAYSYAPVAAAAPAPVAYAAPVAYNAYNGYAAGYPAVTNQYHSQNHLGEAAYGYSFPGQAHSAVRDALGGVTGAYQYIGAEGKPVVVNYRADSANGFQVSSNALPVAPQVDLVQPRNELVGPEPVDFTPEVKAAREEHFKAVEEAKKLPGYKAGDDDAKSRKKRQAFFYSGAPVAHQALAYHAAAPAYSPYFYSAPAYGYPYAGYPYAYNYGLAPATAFKTVEINPLKPVEGTPASTYKFDI